MRLLLSSSIPTLDTGTIVFRLVVAAALGGAVGIERELRDREAGLRTHLLVSAGSALFTLVSAYGFHEFLTTGGNVIQTDPTRIAAQIVTGIGFLGAGVIFRQGFAVRGLTTAASLWLVAAVGMAAGAGFWKGAVIATGAGLVSLRPLEWLKERMIPQRAENRLVVTLGEGAKSSEVLDALERTGDVLALRRDGQRVDVELRLDRAQRTRTLDAVSALPQVEEARWQS
jgi:putative Mg2+ transporter-C (MgtC) family protein